MQVEYKAWQIAEAKVDEARAEERKAYEAFRKNLNKAKEHRTAEWGVIIAREAADKAFEAYLAA